MKKFKNNKFKVKSKSLSLSKINPYYDDKKHYLPYKYKDPSFKTQYNGPLMQKDYYILNLMNNRLKKVVSHKAMSKEEVPLIQSTPIEIFKKSDLVFNSSEIERQKLKKEYTKYAFIRLRKNFFDFNPISTKNDLIKYRKNNFRGITNYKDQIKINPKIFLMNFQKQIIQKNYQNWKKIKEEYEKKEIINPIKNDKYYDENKIWEILNINKRNICSYSTNLPERDKSNKEKCLISFPEIKKNYIFKSKNKDGKKVFNQIKEEKDEKI